MRQSHRCGYVAVPEGHPAYVVGDYDDVPAKVHGGLTFANDEIHDEIDTSEDVMWFGFDCAHAGDKTRGITANLRDDAHFWTEEEVIEETEKLADQLAGLTWTEIVEHKMRFMPDWFKDRVDLAEKSQGENGG